MSATGSPLSGIVTDRREGDPASVVGVVDVIREFAGWNARLTVADIAESAWESRKHFDELAARP